MKVTIEFPKIRIDADILKKANIPKVLQQEMLNVRAEIIEKTTAGQQANGGGLKPYSASYKDAIDSGRIAGKAPGNHTPNLTATGELMRSMTIANTPDGAEMTFRGSHAPRRPVSAAGAARKQKAAGVQSTKLRGKGAVKAAGGGAARRKGSGGSSVPNATIARAQYSQGRTGWFQISDKRVEKVKEAVRAAVQAALKNLVTR